MNGLTGLTPHAVEALGLALVHFVWQGTVVAGLLSIALTCLARASSRTRYAAACMAMVLMLAIPAGTFLRLVATPTPVVVALDSVTDATSDASSDEVVSPAPAALEPLAGSLDPGTKTVEANRTMRATATEARAAREARHTVKMLAIPGPGGAPVVIRARACCAPARPMLPWLVVAWGLGVVVLSIRLFGGWMLTQRLKRSLIDVPAGTLRDRVQDLTTRMKLRERARVRVGAGRDPDRGRLAPPVVLLPASTLTGLSPGHLDALLAHELAHIRRHDYLVNLIQTVIETLLFYHPAVWWVSRRIREERENCCDDIAVSIFGDARLVARALVEMEERRVPRLAMAANGGSLLARVRRLIAGSSTPSATAAGWTAGAAIVVTALTVGMGVALSLKAGGAENVAPPTPTVVMPASMPAPPVPPDAAEADAESTPCPDAPPCPASVADVPDVPSVPDVPAVPAVASTPACPQTACTEQPTRSASAPMAPMAPLPSLPQIDQSAMEDLQNQGVDAAYIRQIQSLGYTKFTAQDFIELHNQGVDAAYVRALSRAGYRDLSVEELVTLRQNGVDPEYVAGMNKLARRDLGIDDLVNLRNQGVTPEYAGAFEWIGFKNLSVDDLVTLRQQGLTPEYAAELRALGYRAMSIEDVLKLQTQGVDLGWVAQIRAAGYANLSADELIELRNSGVDGDFVLGMRAATTMHYTVQDLVLMREHGVSADYVSSLASVGMRRLPAEDVARLRDHGVSAEAIDKARRKGYTGQSIQTLIDWQDKGGDFSFDSKKFEMKYEMKFETKTETKTESKKR
jgi:beta-lactamase regulating signal transducer with metallopeptidase domain